ncbi:MAG: polysaccharide biosynthesis protein [Anaerolineae bacterium]|nr:polysaccharide biosynthesis protein [Anaerolineae bacterium]
MVKRLRNRHFFFIDVILLALAAYLSFVLRLEGFDLADGIWVPTCIVFAIVSVVLTPIVFRRVGVYARYWRYASIEELLLLVGGVTVADVVVSAVSYLLTYMLGIFPVPRSVPFIFLMLALGATAFPRLLTRFLNSYRRTGNPSPGATAVLVMGAGSAGAMIVRELHNNPQLGYEVVGFLDDDMGKHDVRIHSVKVLGDRNAIPRIVMSYNIDLVIIAIPTASGKSIREIVSICEKVGVQTKIIPGMYELIGGSVSINQLRDVQIEDLLRREPVQTDTAAVRDLIQGKRVLVTGGGGSIGSELCRQIIRHAPEELIILGHGENSIFGIYNELEKAGHPHTTLTAVIADTRSAERIHTVFAEYCPQIVFHAAAHKHVHLMEANPAEAITNNVMGTRNVLNAALAVNAEQFVLISTDKAVNPKGIMGASKRAAELLVHQAARQSGKPYAAVRFGNVLGSRGSVVLTFKQQIAAGGPVTITHPDMVRYFMTIPEAVQLTLQAAVLGKGGEVFVLDMGEPVKIVDLARDLIELSGLEVGRDIDITFTGIRPGEKLYEEMFNATENYKRTRHEKIFIAANASLTGPLNLSEMIDVLEESARRDDKVAILRGLQNLIPEYRPDSGEPSDGARKIEAPQAQPPIPKFSQTADGKPRM